LCGMLAMVAKNFSALTAGEHGIPHYEPPRRRGLASRLRLPDEPILLEDRINRQKQGVTGYNWLDPVRPTFVQNSNVLSWPGQTINCGHSLRNPSLADAQVIEKKRRAKNRRKSGLLRPDSASPLLALCPISFPQLFPQVSKPRKNWVLAVRKQVCGRVAFRFQALPKRSRQSSPHPDTIIFVTG
jgi:hypothetical protein